MAALATLILPEVLGLMFFHCYLSLCLYKTTLEVIRGELNAEENGELHDYAPRSKKKEQVNEESNEEGNEEEI